MFSYETYAGSLKQADEALKKITGKKAKDFEDESERSYAREHLGRAIRALFAAQKMVGPEIPPPEGPPSDKVSDTPPAKPLAPKPVEVRSPMMPKETH